MQLFDWLDPERVKMMEFSGAGDRAYKVDLIDRQ
jgi:hypothetical protein